MDCFQGLFNVRFHVRFDHVSGSASDREAGTRLLSLPDSIGSSRL